MANLLKLRPWSEDRSLHVVIETPRGSAVKVKLDPDLRVFTIARPLPEGMVYPFDFGFVRSICLRAYRRRWNRFSSRPQRWRARTST